MKSADIVAIRSRGPMERNTSIAERREQSKFGGSGGHRAIFCFGTRSSNNSLFPGTLGYAIASVEGAKTSGRLASGWTTSLVGLEKA